MPGRPRCRRGTSRFCRGDRSASFITRVRGFLTIAHVVSKRLLVILELKPEIGVPSEPCTELIPLFFSIELCAILVVWAICHFRSEGISLVFFPRVRTPCGHGAQVIVEGRESPSDGGENNKDHNKNPKTTNKGPQAESPPSCNLSSVLGETGETRKNV